MNCKRCHNDEAMFNVYYKGTLAGQICDNCADEAPGGLVMEHMGGSMNELEWHDVDGSRIEEHMSASQFCPECGQWFAAHNDDGSCVQDEPFRGKALSVRRTIREFLHDYGVMDITALELWTSDPFMFEFVDSGKQDAPAIYGRGLVRAMADYLDVDVMAHTWHQPIKVKLVYCAGWDTVDGFDAFVVDNSQVSAHTMKFVRNWGAALAADAKAVEFTVYESDPPQLVAALIAGLKSGGVEVRIAVQEWIGAIKF